MQTIQIPKGMTKLELWLIFALICTLLLFVNQSIGYSSVVEAYNDLIPEINDCRRPYQLAREQLPCNNCTINLSKMIGEYGHN